MLKETPSQSMPTLQEKARIYLVGIGGISMSGLAEIAHAAGFSIAGSDLNQGPRTDYLRKLNIRVHDRHAADFIDAFRPDLVVYTAAVPADNPELQHARKRGIPTIDRAHFLGWLNRTFQEVINIAGTHGKTTTTALCSLILMAAAQNPTVHLGAELDQFGSTVHLGEPGKLMVSEACEYMDSFLQFHSTTAAILNIDFDHVDFYQDLRAVIDSFVAFADHLPDEGRLIHPDFDPRVDSMLKQLAQKRHQAGRKMPRLVPFGTYSPQAKPQGFYARNLTYEQGLPRFEVWHENKLYTRLKLKIPGQHNVHNVLAAIACAHAHGATPTAAQAVCESFRGAEGRFTETGLYRGARVIADYAHHPAAARATLRAAANIPHEHIWVVFQPLTYTRTRILFDDFVDALKDCEEVIFSEIYSDRDQAGPDKMSSKKLVKRINDLGGKARFASSFAQIRARLDQVVNPGDLILILGPENIRQLADQLTGRKHPF